ncbi:MAG: hypothetical protein Q7V01_14225, partial [Vicinamibacterales bacterium]|nr:hypothetical protein [Vicinamibacterales bacterium]
MKRFRRALIAVSLAVALTGVMVAASDAAQDGATPPAAAQAPVPAAPAREVTPEQKAYQDAVKIGDPDKKIEALRKVIADFPNTPTAGTAESQILTTLVRRATDTVSAIQEQARKMSAADTGTGRSVNGSVATALLNANLLLDDAETFALKAVSLVGDQQKYIDAQKKAFADRQAEALKKDPAAKPMTPPEEATLVNGFKSAKQTALVTLAQVYDKRGKATDAEKTFKDAYTLAPKGSGAATAALKLAAY